MPRCLLVQVESLKRRKRRRILGAPVLAPSELPALMRERRTPIVASVARLGPRSQVRAALDALGFAELEDYVCAA